MVAMTLAVAATSLVPATACAHAGHNHGVQPTRAAAAPYVFATTEIGQEALPSSTEQQDEGWIMKATGAEATSLVLPQHDAKLAHGCSGGCCHHGGQGCCALWLAGRTELFAPHLGRSIWLRIARVGPGVTPGALPEPPDLLV
jgi:hypothetical protein